MHHLHSLWHATFARPVCAFHVSRLLSCTHCLHEGSVTPQNVITIRMSKSGKIFCGVILKHVIVQKLIEPTGLFEWWKQWHVSQEYWWTSLAFSIQHCCWPRFLKYFVAILLVVQAIVGGDLHFADNLFKFGDQDGYGSSALLQHPLAVCAMGPTSVAVADSYNHRIKASVDSSILLGLALSLRSCSAPVRECYSDMQSDEGSLIRP